MRKNLISEEERKMILESHTKAGYNSSEISLNEEDGTLEMTEKKLDTVDDLEKEIEKLEKKLEELKSKKSKKKETKEDEFSDLIDADSDLEVDRDSLEQS